MTLKLRYLSRGTPAEMIIYRPFRRMCLYAIGQYGVALMQPLLARHGRAVVVPLGKEMLRLGTQTEAEDPPARRHRANCTAREGRLCGEQLEEVKVRTGSGCDGRPIGFIAGKPALKVRCP